MKEVAQAVVMGSVATNGVQRQFEGEDIEEMRNDA